MLVIIFGIIVLYCVAKVTLDIWQIRLLKKQRRAAVFENAKARMDRARQEAEYVKAVVEADGKAHYFENEQEAEAFQRWSIVPELDEMSDEEFEYKK